MFHAHLPRRLPGLTLLETVMVLVVLGVVIVSALTVGQGMLDSRRAQAAADQVRLVVAAAEQVTGGKKDFRGLTSGSVRSLLPANMQGTVGTNTRAVTIGDGRFPVALGPGVAVSSATACPAVAAAAFVDPATGLLAPAGFPCAAGARDVQRHFVVAVGGIDQAEVCASIAALYDDDDYGFMGLVVQSAATNTGYNAVRDGAAGAPTTVAPLAAVSTTIANYPDIEDLGEAYWAEVCESITTTTNIMLAFR